MDKLHRPWLNHYDDGVPRSIDYPSITVDRLLSRSAVAHPGHPAVVFGARLGSRLLESRLSYLELETAVNRFAAGLQALGVVRGDRVTIMLPNCPQFIIAAYATWRIGGVVVCCNPLYVEREIEHLLEDSGAETFVVMSALYERVRRVRPGSPLKRVVVTSIKEYRRRWS